MVSTNLREQVFLRVNAFTFQYVNPLNWHYEKSKIAEKKSEKEKRKVLSNVS